jgi:hypothetical protein
MQYNTEHRLMPQKRRVRCILVGVLSVLVSLLLGIICVAQPKWWGLPKSRDTAPRDAQVYRINTGLSLPFQNPEDIDYLWCFGLQPWDTEGRNEIHGGIDLVPKYYPDVPKTFLYPIVAPAGAEVVIRVDGTSGDVRPTFAVVLKMNDYWYLLCNFEPQSVSDAINRAQSDSIVVREGQRVRRGQLLGKLVVSGPHVRPGSYPHLHFGLFYKNPMDTLEDIGRHQEDFHRSDGRDLAPTSGPGSPWEPRDLGIETTFYCPYEYSSPAAKAIYNRLPKRAANGESCSCVCAYGSVRGNCGVCRMMTPVIPSVDRLKK